MSEGKERMMSNAASPPATQSRVTDSRIMGKEEIADIRNQLQNEAENIACWKASTEIKAKNMERELQEKQNIIDDQRRNLMELQLHSEHLSQSLFQERQERKLVADKVGHTRQLFLSLQEQHKKLSETVSCFQSIKDEIQMKRDLLIEDLKGLNENFKLQKDTIEKLTLEAKEDAHNFEKARESLKRNIIKKDQELKELNVQVKDLKSEKQNLAESLESTTSNLSSVQNEKTQLCSQLDEVRTSLLKAEEQYKLQYGKLSEQITRADEELKLEHEQLVERTKEFQEAAEKIQYLKKANDTLEGANSELTERVTALAARKQGLEEEIIYKENINQTLQSDQERSVKEINELNGKVSEMCSQLSIVENHRESLEQERNKLAEKFQTTKKKLLKKKNLLEQFKEQVMTLESDLEAKKTALMHMEEENKKKEEIIHNLEVSLNESKKDNITCNETLQEMEQKISLAEHHEAQFIEEKKKTEEELKKVSSDLKAKDQECEDLLATIKELKGVIKTTEKECEAKIKNVSSETKSRRILEQKIHGLEEKLKKAANNAENQETELKKVKIVVTEKEKELEEFKKSLDQCFSEKQEIQNRCEAKDQSFQIYKNDTNSNLETLKAELDLTKEMLVKNKSEHEQQVHKLQEELEEAKKTMKSSEAAHKIELQGIEKTLLDQNNITVEQHMEEVASLEAKIEIMTKELKQVKEEASIAIKEKLNIKLESDNKVKEMSDLLDKYKTDKEAKLKIAEEELQKSQSQNTQLMKEKDELLARIKAQINNCNANEKVKVAITQAMKNEVEKVSIPPPMSPNIKTPSPESYLDIMNTFAKPSIPQAPRSIIKPEADKVQHGKPVSSILKTSRRTLLPPEFQKRVVFKPLTSTRDYTSGDSSSDAYALEAADSDEPFEEIRRIRRYPNIRPETVPRASVAPFLPKMNTPQKIPSSHNEHNVSNEVNRGPPANSSKRKRGRSDQQKLNVKTYSAVSPKNKQQKMP